MGDAYNFDNKGFTQNEADAVSLKSIKREPSFGYVQDGGLPNKSDKTGERTLSDKQKNEEKRKIMKNVFIISLAFLLNFISMGLSRLQSSLHQVQGMGVINSSVLYAAMVLSCFFLPKLVIAKLGHKWTIATSFIGYFLWAGANGIGQWWSMTPASIINGICAAPLWTAQCSYFTKYAVRYAKLVGETHQATVTKFFGIFFALFQSAGIFGAIISSTILNLKPENGSEVKTSLEYCGRNDCPSNNHSNPNLEKPPPVVVWTMVGVYMGVIFLAVLLVGIFMDPLPKELENEDRPESVKKDILRLLVATVRHLRHTPQLLLIPLTVYSGLEQGFFSAEWTKSFISCGLGIWMVGFATLPFGIMNALMSFIGGRLAKYTGRIPFFLTGFTVDIAIHITLYSWMPNPNQPAVFYVISALWGFTDAIWQTQINALYGSIFKDESEAAFSNYRLWESLGFIIAFAYSAYICTLYKTVVLTSVLCIGICGYLVTEFITRKGKSVVITSANI